MNGGGGRGEVRVGWGGHLAAGAPLELQLHAPGVRSEGADDEEPASAARLHPSPPAHPLARPTPPCCSTLGPHARVDAAAPQGPLRGTASGLVEPPASPPVHAGRGGACAWWRPSRLPQVGRPGGGGGGGAHILRQFAALAVQPQPHEHREAHHLHGHLRPMPPRSCMAPFPA